MSESGLNSDEESRSEDSESYEDSEFSGDDSYDYTGEDSGAEESLSEEEGERGDSSLSSSMVGALVQQDEWQYCEQAGGGASWPPRQAPQVYAPERGPPLLDFLFVLTAFFAACFAAYYTIFTEDVL